VLDRRIDAAFILEAMVDGAIWDAEKVALRRGLDARRSVWRMSGIATVGTEVAHRVLRPA
jgi:hypothetical protein